MMSYLRSGPAESNGTYSMHQLLTSILSSLTEEDIERGYAMKLLQQALAANNVSLNAREMALLESHLIPPDLGPRRDGLTTVVPITIIHCIIFITGVIGNVCTCFVIIRNKYMRTVTNYYLFHLSVSDLLLLLLGLPQETYSTWVAYPYVFGETFCRFRLMASEASSNVSVLTITAFTVERYVAICHPIKCPTRPGLMRPLRVMLAVWVVAILCAVPVGLQFGIVHREWRGRPLPESATCNTLDEDNAKIVFQMSTFIFFVLPMSVLSFLYFLIALAIRRSTLIRSGSDSSADTGHSRGACNPRRGQSNKRQARVRQSVLKMLVAVVVGFFLCWAPFHTQRLMVVYVQHWTSNMLRVHHVLFYVSGLAYYLSATINPVMYSIMSLKFRQAFHATLLCCCCCCWARSKPKRRVVKNSYTFKFQHRNPIHTYCSVVDSSSSTNNNTNNQQGSKHSSNQPPLLCCGTGNLSLSSPIHDGHPLIALTPAAINRPPSDPSAVGGQHRVRDEHSADGQHNINDNHKEPPDFSSADQQRLPAAQADHNMALSDFNRVDYRKSPSDGADQINTPSDYSGANQLRELADEHGSPPYYSSGSQNRALDTHLGIPPDHIYCKRHRLSDDRCYGNYLTVSENHSGDNQETA